MHDQAVLMGMVQAASIRGYRRRDLVSRKVLSKSFCRSHFPHKFVNVFFILVMVKDQVIDLWRS